LAKLPGKEYEFKQKIDIGRNSITAIVKCKKAYNLVHEANAKEIYKREVRYRDLPISYQPCNQGDKNA